MPEKPKKGKDGKLYARFDILDTPNGRIAYTLAKYGYKLGVSSRGDGDVYEAFDGKEHVDPKTYSLKAFDLVILPAVKAARLALKESVGNKTLKQALTESLNSATKDEKAIMIETLERLNIDYKTKKVSNKKITESVAQTKENTAGNTGDWMMKELQTQIKKNKELTESLVDVQEKLSVCYAKEAKYEEKISQLAKSSSNKEEVKSLKEQIRVLTEKVENQDKTIKTQRIRLIKLAESVKSNDGNNRSLNEQLSIKDNESKKKDSTIKTLQEKLSQERAQSAEKTKTLTESIEELKRDKQIKAKEYSEKIAKANRIVEHYRNQANKAMDRYIESKAKMFGMISSDIKSRLGESYTFDDVDKICEGLSGYKVALGKLPIALQDKKVKVRVTESKEPINKGAFDDTVDDSLFRLIDRL